MHIPIMAATDFFLYAELGMLLFLIVFISIVIHALRKPKAEVDRLASMAIDDDPKPE